jgi:hypothetical protein
MKLSFFSSFTSEEGHLSMDAGEAGEGEGEGEGRNHLLRSTPHRPSSIIVSLTTRLIDPLFEKV